MKCEAIFKGTQVDGVYDNDPKTDKTAKHYKRISYDEVLQKNLKVMDASAIALARDNGIPIIVFSLKSEDGISSIVSGKGKFTKIIPVEKM